jgi:hypothetical protein
MGHRSPGVRVRPRCEVETAVTDVEFDVVLAERHRISTPLREVRCELLAGHSGSHVAFVMAAYDGERWWWARWDTWRHEVVSLGVCAGPFEAEHDDCLLPEGHPGEHSFQLAAG